MSNEPTDFSYFSKRNAALHGDKLAYAFSDGDQVVASLSFAQLDQAARGIAAALQERRLGGEPVLLLLESGMDFVRAFIGCLYAGAIAVPVNLPTRAQRIEKIRLIAKDSRARLAIVSPRVAQELAASSEFDCLEVERLLAEAESRAGTFRDVRLTADAPAFLQYTSGSTGAPKGVMVSHRNLIANQAMIGEGFGHQPDTVFASWLPLYHDMGLVGTMLHPTYLGIPAWLMPPLAFVQRPVRWLKLISEARATTSGGPNFAYELCVRRVDEEELSGLDLSSWRVAFNGAEPVRASTLSQFYDKFAACGLSRSAMYPCYGMAEATLFVAGSSALEPPRTCVVAADALERGDVREQSGAGPQRELVSCGRGYREQRIVIVDPHTLEELAPGLVGEIWVAGPHVALGYWNNPEATESSFRARTRAGEGPFLRTGDLGFVRGGELYVTGRSKDLIIVSGKNHYPQDIELTVSRAHPALAARPGAAVAVSRDGVDEIAVVQEVDVRVAPGISEAELVRCVRAAVLDEHGLALRQVVLIAAGKLPMTTSGKVQRSLCRSLLLSGAFTPVMTSATPTRAVEGG